MFERMSRRGARIGRRGEKKGGAPLQRSVWLHLQLRWLLFEIMQLRLGYLGRPGGTTFSHFLPAVRQAVKCLLAVRKLVKGLPAKCLPAVRKVVTGLPAIFFYQQQERW